MSPINRKRRRPTATHALHVGMMLHQVASRWQRTANEALSEFGINHTQYLILWGIHTLRLENISPTQVEVSSFTGTDVMLTSKTLRTLEDLGLVIRVPHPTDTRARCISLSALGITTFQLAENLVSDVEHRLFGRADQEALRSNLVTLLGTVPF